jgi:hypothetical protein
MLQNIFIFNATLIIVNLWFVISIYIFVIINRNPQLAKLEPTCLQLKKP